MKWYDKEICTRIVHVVGAKNVCFPYCSSVQSSHLYYERVLDEFQMASYFHFSLTLEPSSISLFEHMLYALHRAITWGYNGEHCHCPQEVFFFFFNPRKEVLL